MIGHSSSWYDPPEEPTHWECSRCGETFDGSDLTETPPHSDDWLCDECSKTMTVRVVDRSDIRPIIVAVEISVYCPVCKELRGTPTPYTFYEDGETYTCDKWFNPCGHQDLYANLIDNDEPPQWR